MAPRPTRRPANRQTSRLRLKARRLARPNRKVIKHGRPFWKIDRDLTNRFSTATPEQPVADIYSPTAPLDPKREPPPNTDPWADQDDPGMTAGQLRDAIDSGRTGDKVNVSDPAAAPLGTDAEAGGHPPTRRQTEMAAGHELSGPETQGIARRPLAPKTRLFDRPLLAALVAGGVVAALGLAVLFALGLLS